MCFWARDFNRTVPLPKNLNGYRGIVRATWQKLMVGHLSWTSIHPEATSSPESSRRSKCTRHLESGDGPGDEVDPGEYSRWNKYQLIAKSRLRDGTEPTIFVPKLLSNTTYPYCACSPDWVVYGSAMHPGTGAENDPQSGPQMIPLKVRNGVDSAGVDRGMAWTGEWPGASNYDEW